MKISAIRKVWNLICSGLGEETIYRLFLSELLIKETKVLYAITQRRNEKTIPLVYNSQASCFWLCVF